MDSRPRGLRRQPCVPRAGGRAGVGGEQRQGQGWAEGVVSVYPATACRMETGRPAGEPKSPLDQSEGVAWARLLVVGLEGEPNCGGGGTLRMGQLRGWAPGRESGESGLTVRLGPELLARWWVQVPSQGDQVWLCAR